MKPSDVESVLTKIFSQDERNTVVLLLGPPGVGKTSVVASAASKAHKPLLTLALPTCEAVDLRGLPHIEGGATKWAFPLPRTGEGVVLLDELSSAPPDVQVAAHHVVWAEKGSDMSLGIGQHVVLTGNRATDRTLHRAVSGPLRNRLTIVEFEADLADWATWGLNNGIHPFVVSFLRWRPEFFVAKEVPESGAFPTPRAWHRTANIMNLSISANLEQELLAGTVGLGPATEFAAYLRTARELPHIEAIINDQENAAVPNSPSQLYALSTSLAQYTKENQISAMKYIERLPAEFGLLYIRDVRDYYDIAQDRDIVKWVSKHKTMFKASQ